MVRQYPTQHNHMYTQVEDQRVRSLAREYRRQGYLVTLHPSAAELPPVLTGCSFSLLAVGQGKTIATEVRTRETLTCRGADNLANISRLVSQLPGWEFELVVTNPRKRSHTT